MLSAGFVATHHTIHLDPGSLLVALFRVTHTPGRRGLVLLRVSGVTFPHPISVSIGVSPAPGHHGHNSTKINKSYEKSRRQGAGVLAGGGHRARGAEDARLGAQGWRSGGCWPFLAGEQNRTDRLSGMKSSRPEGSDSGCYVREVPGAVEKFCGAGGWEPCTPDVPDCTTMCWVQCEFSAAGSVRRDVRDPEEGRTWTIRLRRT